MCGIWLQLRDNTSSLSDNNAERSREEWIESIRRRGPDAVDTLSTTAAGGLWTLEILASVLHVRGSATTRQPVQLPSGSIFCWNGEVYDGMEVPAPDGDTYLVAQAADKAMALSTSLQDGVDRLCQVLEGLDAEYAFVLYSATANALIFGRDVLGRRSLVYHSSPGAFFLASVCPSAPEGWSELAASALFALPLNSFKSSGDDPWQSVIRTAGPHSAVIADSLAAIVRPLVSYPTLSSSVASPSSLPHVGQLSAGHAEALALFRCALERSVQLRTLSVHLSPSLTTTPVAVLFSGGIDCTVLAALVDQALPPQYEVDLLNVAFENPRVVDAQRKTAAANRSLATPVDPYDVPDRRTGRQALAELAQRSPHRKWNLVEVNVPFADALRAKQRIAELMAPLDTEMDMSIAMAFYFAARGTGLVAGVPYASTARVLISGLGADEQLGGYGRHRVKFKTDGWQGLAQEIALDVGRIAARNLGRDDRIISDHGREVRFPFLALPVMQALAQTPVDIKCDMRYDKGVGDKMLLRLLARDLALPLSAREEKRAIQFGSRTAKMLPGSGRLQGTARA